VQGHGHVLVRVQAVQRWEQLHVLAGQEHLRHLPPQLRQINAARNVLPRVEFIVVAEYDQRDNYLIRQVSRT
jgi:hypothetical protein